MGISPTGEKRTPPVALQAYTTLAEQIESFETLLRVHVTLYDFAHYFHIDGHPLIPERHHAHDRCGFCRCVKDDLGLMRDCYRCDMEPILERARGAAQWRRCHAGVWEVVFPLWDGETLIGAMLVGCFRRGGERPLVEVTGSPATVLKQTHGLLRDLNPETEARLPALVENFAQGLVRQVVLARRLDLGDVDETTTTFYLPVAGTPGPAHELEPSKALAPIGEATVAVPVQASGGVPVVGAGVPPAFDPHDPRGGRRRTGEQRARAIQLFIRTHIGLEIQISDLADHLHLSAARTSQLLRRELKTTFPSLVRRTRIDEAQRLLTVSELSIGRIAELVGFPDRNYFCRVFRQETQLTPSAYRSQHARIPQA